MSEKEIGDVHQIGAGPVHPAVELAAHMALNIYSNRSGTISADAFERLVHGVSIHPHWADLDLNMETAALMVATALQFGSWLHQTSALTLPESPIDPVAAQTHEITAKAMEAVASLSTLADQFGGVSRA